MGNDIYSAPEASVEMHDGEENTIAGRWARLGASIIDSLTFLPIVIPIMFFTGGFNGIESGEEPTFLYNLSITLVSIVIFLLIHGYFLVNNGQTLGKKALGIKIVTMDDRHADLPTLLKRYGFYWLPAQIPFAGPLISLVNILFIFSSSKRCIHDLVAGTKVVNK